MFHIYLSFGILLILISLSRMQSGNSLTPNFGCSGLTWKQFSSVPHVRKLKFIKYTTPGSRNSGVCPLNSHCFLILPISFVNKMEEEGLLYRFSLGSLRCSAVGLQCRHSLRRQEFSHLLQRQEVNPPPREAGAKLAEEFFHRLSTFQTRDRSAQLSIFLIPRDVPMLT